MAKIYGNRWEIIQSIGEGGQGQASLVVDKNGTSETRYVLKRLKNINRIDRFRKEIEVMRNISHENIVRLVDFNIEDDKPFLVTEYYNGGSLEDAEPFWHNSVNVALELFLQVCRGVAYAHSQDIIHRDIKPANIFLRTKNGPAVVGDFGICYVEDDGTRLTLTDEPVGPRFFMAPELEDGRVEQVSKQSDSYSLGKLLYWLLSRGKVFSREKHRERQRDLRKWNDVRQRWDNIYMEHINRILDKTITSNRHERLYADSLVLVTEEAARLIRREFIPIGTNIQPPCQFCGQGFYVSQPNDTNSLHNFGLSPVNPDNWRIFVCDTCGHVQLFNIEIAKQKDWWD